MANKHNNTLVQWHIIMFFRDFVLHDRIIKLIFDLPMHIWLIRYTHNSRIIFLQKESIGVLKSKNQYHFEFDFASY